MRPAECLFDIIRLRGSSRPLSAAVLAARLEVSVRAIYRDVASLLGSGVRIEGASGFGYVLGSGYDLHPLMFTAAEFQTIAVALDLPPRTDDRGLQEAAAWGRAKVVAVRLPTSWAMAQAPYYVWTWGASVAPAVCTGAVREVIHVAHKLRLDYVNRDGVESRRVVWPLAIAYFSESTLICGCRELRQDYRHFRTDRVHDPLILEEAYPTDCPTLLSGWRALQDQLAPTASHA